MLKIVEHTHIQCLATFLIYNCVKYKFDEIFHKETEFTIR